jgi:hypothetical protein
MYRIQAFNTQKKHFFVYTCSFMEERDALIKELLETGNYSKAGISWEWLARY